MARVRLGGGVGNNCRLTIVAIVLLSQAACGGPASVPPVVAGGNGDDTTLGAGDVFEVRVFGQEDLSDQYRVSPDGSIDFPLIGRLHVAGLEPTAVADVLTERLREGQFLVNPQISVLVEEYNSKRISVIGAVREPGSFPMQSGLTVVQAIGLAGGFTALANRDGTVLTRRVGGEIRRYRIPVDSITDGRRDDVPIQAGDILHIPERLF